MALGAKLHQPRMIRKSFTRTQYSGVTLEASSADGVTVAAALVQAVAQSSVAGPAVTLQPDAGTDIQPYLNNPAADPQLPPAMLQKLLQQKIKYVFVIFNENHSFDNEYGTLPGVNGLYSNGQNPRAGAQTPGFTQHYTDMATGADVTAQPFRIGPEQNSSVEDSVDHSHTGLAVKINVDPANGVARMNQFAYDEYHK